MASSRIILERPSARAFVTRFNIHQRVQHLLIITSFFFLAITGLPMKYFTWSASRWWMSVWGGIENVRTVHHFAAWVMVATCVYHLLYLVIHRPFGWSMMPNPRDLRDFTEDILHAVRLRKKGPQFGRWPYRQKGAYFIVFPGAITMISTGYILLYPAGATAHVPGWLVPLALMIHSDAAVLAVGWILTIHIYFAHFAAHTIPFDKGVITGKIDMGRYMHEFPREFATIMADVKDPEKELPPDIAAAWAHHVAEEKAEAEAKAQAKQKRRAKARRYKSPEQESAVDAPPAGAEPAAETAAAASPVSAAPQTAPAAPAPAVAPTAPTPDPAPPAAGAPAPAPPKD